MMSEGFRDMFEGDSEDKCTTLNLNAFLIVLIIVGGNVKTYICFLT